MHNRLTLTRIASRGATALVTCLAAVLATSAAAYDLEQHEWRDRLLVYAASSGDDDNLNDLRQRIGAQQAAITERHLRVFELLPNAGSVDGRALSAQDVDQLRNAFDIATTDQVLLLVGKDGGVKARGPLTTQLADVFQLIDGMPMRQREMRMQRQGRDNYR
jgi:hypothetical protein